MTRTDIHRPSAPEFDPQAYDLAGCFDLRPEFPGESRFRLEVVRSLLDQGYRFAGTGTDHCGHCGHFIRYAALMTRSDVREMIYVGEQCLDNRFDLTKAEFDALRKNAALNRERTRKAEKIEALVAEFPILAWLTYPETALSTFVGDIGDKFRAYGELSGKQIEAVSKAIVRDTERSDARIAREAEAEALRQSGVEVPEGRIVIEGRVVAQREVDGFYGTTFKMLVVSDEGWKVWGTEPSSINPEIGDRVRFTATVEKSADDALFGFYKRPTKAEIL